MYLVGMGKGDAAEILDEENPTVRCHDSKAR